MNQTTVEKREKRYKYGERQEGKRKLVGAMIPDAVAGLFKTTVKKQGSTANFELYRFIVGYLKRHGVEIPEGLSDPLGELEAPDGIAMETLQ